MCINFFNSLLFVLVDFSPFAIVEAGEEGAASAMGGEDELSQSMKDFTEMALTHQVLHPDCRPVLEFRIVRGDYSSIYFFYFIMCLPFMTSSLFTEGKPVIAWHSLSSSE